MTNAEAIEYIKKNCYGEWCEDDWREAMDMAIEALKCSETPKSSERAAETAQTDHIAESDKKVSISCAHENDLISREAAIEAIAKQMPRSYTPDGSHPADEEIFKAQEIYVDCIESIEILPAAQPETNCSEIPNGSDDTISRQAAIDAMGKAKWAKERLMELPSVQPEPRWIPCTERMPHNTGDFYLCTAKLSVDDEYEVELLMLDTANDFDKSYFSKCIHNGLVFRESWSGGNEALDVIAWMPLPEAYRGGDE